MTEIEKAKFECACKLLETVVTSEQKKKANARMTEQEIVDYVSALVNGTFSGITTP